MATPKLQSFGNWWKGIGISKYDSAFFDDLVNADILSEVGTIRCAPKLTKESGTTITEPVIIEVAPSGTAYLFSKTSGKIWKRATDGTYSTITANTNATGHLSARFYDGFMYYTVAGKLGRFVPDTEGSRNNNWQTFTNADALFHPMEVIGNVLQIGDGNFIALVDDAGTFTAEGLDLPAERRIIDLKAYGTDTIAGFGISSYKAKAGIVRWDGTSTSYSYEDFIDEPWINYFISCDSTDLFFVSAGTKGNIYLFDGTRLSYFTTMRTFPTYGNHQSTSFDRKPVFSAGGKVFSLAIPQRVMAPALNNDYTASAGASATIYSICAFGSTILVAWGLSGDYGVDKLDTALATCSFTTPLVVDLEVQDIFIPFDLLPAGTSITLEVDKDNAGFVSKDIVKDATDNNMYRLASSITVNRTVRARVTLTPNGTATPVVPAIHFV